MRTKPISFITLPAIVTLLIFSSCKKYEDNPVIVLSKKETRLVGTWQVIMYTADGEDCLSYTELQETLYDDQCGEYIKTTTGTRAFCYEFEKNKEVNVIETRAGSINYNFEYNDSIFHDTTLFGGEVIAGSGIWEFGDEKKKLQLTIKNTGPPYPYYYDYPVMFVEYSIQQLTKKTLKLKGIDNGKIIEIIMEKER